MGNTHFSGPVSYSSDDFTGVAIDATNDWTVVKDSSASVAILADQLNGVVLLSSQATTDNDGSSIQGNEIFGLPSDAGNKLYFESRVTIADVDQTEVFVGVCENFATAPENIFAAASRIGFQLDDGSAALHLITESGGTETDTTTSTSLADDTFVTLSFVATKGTSTDVVEFYVNRALVGTHTTNVPTANMTAAAGEVSGDASGTKTLGLDYVLTSQDRGVSY